MPAACPPPPDWPALLGALRQSGVTCSQVARALGVQPSTVCRWRSGKAQPNFRQGAGLLALVHPQAPAAGNSAVAQLAWLLAPGVTSDLQAPAAVVGDLRASHGER
jgi:hypothetical protein